MIVMSEPKKLRNGAFSRLLWQIQDYSRQYGTLNDVSTAGYRVLESLCVRKERPLNRELVIMHKNDIVSFLKSSHQSSALLLVTIVNFPLDTREES